MRLFRLLKYITLRCSPNYVLTYIQSTETNIIEVKHKRDIPFTCLDYITSSDGKFSYLEFKCFEPQKPYMLALVPIKHEHLVFRLIIPGKSTPGLALMHKSDVLMYKLEKA